MVLSLDPGGTERLVIELASRLHAELPTAVCCLDAPGRWSSELTGAGITVTALGRRPGFRPLLGRRLADAVRAHRADVVHAHHYTPFVYSCLARRFGARTPIVYTEHGRLSDAPPSRKRRLANRWFGPCADRVAAVSADLKRHMVAEGFPADEIDVVHNGIEVGRAPAAANRDAARGELGLSPSAFVAGTVARLDPVKDLATLVRAAGRRPELTVLVIGDGPERAALEALAAREAPGRIRCLGQRADARRLLAACDAYVNCSISEGVSLTILEAMAAGLPIVATAVGGTPEVIDSASGLLIPPRDAGALGQALDRLAQDVDLRARLGAAARARVEAHFTIERMVDDYRRAYLRAAGLDGQE